MEMTPSDPVIDEVRAARHRISEQVGHDSARLVAYYMKFQERYPGRLIRSSMAEEPTSEVGPASGCSAPAARSAEPQR